MLDSDRVIRKDLIPKFGALDFGFGPTVLIEIYRQTSKEQKFDFESEHILIPGLFTSPAGIGEEWPIVDFKEIDPAKVDFPENLSVESFSSGKFVKGEIEVIINIEGVDDMELFLVRLAAVAIPETVLYNLGRKDEIDADPDVVESRNIALADIRFSGHKEKIYRQLPDKYKGDYYNMAKAHGFDLARLYE